MRFITRALTGLGLTLATLSLLGAAGWHLYSTMSLAETRSRPPARERTFVVDAGKLTKTNIAPVINAFGQVQVWNSLEIRAPVAGPITKISPNFREGMSVGAGDLLFNIDPELAERRVTDAKAALAQAETELNEAAMTERHIESEIEAAKAEADVRMSDLERKKSLFEKKLTTSTARDDAILAVSAAQQNVVAKERELLALKGRIDKAEAGVARARLTLSDSERALSDTSYRAPFSGRLSEVALTLGRRVSQNEKLGLLIDPLALEVAFPVRNSDFGNLLDLADNQKLSPLKTTVALDLSGKSVIAEAVLDRPAAVASSQAGRTVYARITGGEINVLRPGDFVEVSIALPQVDRVAVIPADAATLDGRILLIGEDGRLKEHTSRIVRRQAETLIVADVPFGATYVERRLPFLSRGSKVDARNVKDVGKGSSPVAAVAPADPPSKALDEERRAALIAFVKNGSKISTDRRQRLLRELEKPAPEIRVIERIERRMTRGGTRS